MKVETGVLSYEFFYDTGSVGYVLRNVDIMQGMTRYINKYIGT